MPSESNNPSPAFRFCFAALLGLAALGAGAGHAQTDVYPARPIHFVVGFPPGGGVDVIARLVADKFAQLLGRPAVVENRPGASTSIATRAVASAKPDGYTLLVNSNSMLANQVTNPGASYNVERELIPVIKAAVQSNIVVAAPDLPVTTLKDLIALSRRQDLTYGSPGEGSIPHLAAESLFTALAGTKLRHIPYAGAAPALIAVAGSQIQLACVTAPPAIPLVNGGKLKGIVVTTARRMSALPNVPTAIESGYSGFVVETWVGFFLPAGTPPNVVGTLSNAILQALALPDVKEKFIALGFESADTAGPAFQREIAGELKQWADVVQKANLKF
jgi:tripartite-type tricarboxylate transporter receptor subunit TctC